MEYEERIRLLLSMQEHPKQFSDEQLQQMLADDSELNELLEELTLTKQAFVKRETDEEAIPVEEEWEKFAIEHADDLETFAKDELHTVTFKTLMGMMPYKLAASIIGILFTAGLAFAAIHIVQKVVKPQAGQTEHAISVTSTLALHRDTVKVDTIVSTQPVVFDNVPLEIMLPQIAAHYQKEVEIKNDDARQLRFYFVWKQDETLDAVLHRLNLFESVTVELKSDKIVVE
ncbi:MAG: DUF4974 domain-containing protein [Prevotella sp.]|nr:DUF4974 domain-containing protein [Prevotella sp.]